jgi:hypothetical protein
MRNWVVTSECKDRDEPTLSTFHISLEFSIWMSESRTELISCGPNIEHPVGQSILLLVCVATKRVTDSEQRVDLSQCVSAVV